MPIEYAEDAARLATPIEWVVDDLIASGSMYILAGKAKWGKKTLTAMHLGRCVASNSAFVGHQSHFRCVIYTFVEDGQKRARWRARQMGFYENQTWKDRTYGFTYGLSGYEEILAEMKAGGLQRVLWIIDPLVDIASSKGLDENSSVEMNALLREHRELAQKTDSTIILVHHFSKPGREMRGSSAFQGSVDGWGDSVPIEGRTDAVRQTWVLRDAAITEYNLQISIPQGTFEFSELEDDQLRSQQEGEVQRAVEDYMTDLPGGTERTNSEIHTAINGNRTNGERPIGEKRIRAAVTELIKDGVLRRRGPRGPVSVDETYQSSR